MSDITIGYKGSTIGTLDATGTKTLLTSGKYCEDDIDIAYVKPTAPAPANLITNGDFSVAGATTDGWSSTNAQSSIAVSGGKLVLTHDTTSNRLYGVYCDVTTQAGHIYLIDYKLTKTMSDSDSDARGIIIGFGDTSGQAIMTKLNVAQDTVLQNATAAKAESDNTQIRITFLGSISTAATSESMLEIEYIKMYDITDIVAGW